MTEYEVDPCFHNAIETLKKYVEKYKDTEDLEIEFRLGYLDSTEFKTDIGREYFQKITDQLIDSESWSSINNELTEDYFLNGHRMSVASAYGTSGTVCIKKEKLAVVDFIFEGAGFDVRVSFSKEVPCSVFPIEKATYKRKKDRTSFLFRNLSYDLTKVTHEDNTVEDHTFEVELEIKSMDLTKMTSHYLIHDALLKIKDLVQMCEEVDYSAELTLVKEKVY